MQQEAFSDGIAVWPFIGPIVLKVSVQSQTHTCTMLRCAVSYCFSLVWWSLSLLGGCSGAVLLQHVSLHVPS